MKKNGGFKKILLETLIIFLSLLMASSLTSCVRTNTCDLCYRSFRGDGHFYTGAGQLLCDSCNDAFLKEYRNQMSSPDTPTDAAVETADIDTSGGSGLVNENDIVFFRLNDSQSVVEIIENRPIRIGVLENTESANLIASLFKPNTYEIVTLLNLDNNDLENLLFGGEIDVFYHQDTAEVDSYFIVRGLDYAVVMDRYRVTATSSVNGSDTANQSSGEILYNDVPLLTLMGSRLESLRDVVGTPDVEGTVWEGETYGYAYGALNQHGSWDVAFIKASNDDYIESIYGWPAALTINGTALDLNREGLVGIFGNPEYESWDNDYGTKTFYIQFTHDTHLITFSLNSPDDRAYEFWISHANGYEPQQIYFEAADISTVYAHAEAGNMEAQNELAMRYVYGKNGVAQDNEQAAIWFMTAAAQGYDRALYNVGVMYQYGIGVEVDLEQAVHWMRLSADQGYDAGQAGLGLMYIRGSGVPQNTEIGIEWLQKAVDQGFANAQINLANIYIEGVLVPADHALAADLMRMAAEQGEAVAQYNLALLYSRGEGVLDDYEQAAYWMLLAAEQGHTQAQREIARMYSVGLGVQKDQAQADYWLKMADR